MKSEFKTVSVVGLGYIGLPTAATLASRGIDVIGVDVNRAAVDTINRGEAHFSEPDLDILMKSTVSVGKLRAVTEPEPADAFLIAVPTPFNKDHSADLSYVEKAARALAGVLKPGNLLILESTSPVGTTEKFCNWIAGERPDLKLPHQYPDNPDINIAYCPERILPGRMVFELVENDRIVGGITPACARQAKRLYEIFVRGTLHLTGAPTAELVKLMENAYRDVNIAFANEMSIFCEKFDLNIWEAISLANKHPRVDILSPGPGVGGHCIAVDPWFLIAGAPKETPLLRTAREVNDSKPHLVYKKVRKQIKRFRKPVVACLGLAYKPDVDDLRESPAMQIVEMLAKKGEARLMVVEPNIDKLPESISKSPHVEGCDLDRALEKADIILLLVRHKQFASVDPRKYLERVFIDTVGLWQRPVQ